MQLNVLNFGGRGNPPLVFLHGTGECAISFADVAQELSRVREVWAFDQRGTGLSGRSGNIAGYSWKSFVTDLRQVVDQCLGDSPADLVGSSIGAIEAVAFAALYPELVRKIILIDTVPGAVPRKIEVIRQLVAERFASREEAFGALGAGYSQAEIETLVRERGGTWGIDFDHALLDVLPPAIFEEAKEFVPAVRAPTLVLSGEKSKIFSGTAAQAFRRLLPSSTILVEKTIPDAGHRIIKDNPSAFIGAVRAFLLSPA